MGRHDFFHKYAPRPTRLRFAVSRVAVFVLVLVVLSWIGLSILLAPPPTTSELETVPLVLDPSGSPASPTPAAPAAPSATSGGTSADSPSSSVATLTVHVVGAVKKPGVYTLPDGARIVDAVKRAGGLRRDAQPERLNLAAKLADGQQVVLPGRNDPGPGAERTQGTQPGTQSAAQPGAGGAAGGKLSLNSADAQALQQLPGIGPALAQRIIDFRSKNGPFSSVAELDAVSGIGPAILENLQDLVEP